MDLGLAHKEAGKGCLRVGYDGGDDLIEERQALLEVIGVALKDGPDIQVDSGGQPRACADVRPFLQVTPLVDCLGSYDLSVSVSQS